MEHCMCYEKLDGGVGVQDNVFDDVSAVGSITIANS